MFDILSEPTYFPANSKGMGVALRNDANFTPLASGHQFARRRSELAAEDLAVAYEIARRWECERVGHLKIRFDVRSLGPAVSQTGYRDPVASIRRIEVKGRTRGHSIRLTTNEWYKAAQLGDSYWLYVVWDPLNNPDPQPLRICNPVKHLDHAKREVVRYFDIPAEAIVNAARPNKEQ